MNRFSLIQSKKLYLINSDCYRDMIDYLRIADVDL